jgi:hypothetical protein
MPEKLLHVDVYSPVSPVGLVMLKGTVQNQHQPEKSAWAQHALTASGPTSTDNLTNSAAMHMLHQPALQ